MRVIDLLAVDARPRQGARTAADGTARTSPRAAGSAGWAPSSWRRLTQVRPGVTRGGGPPGLAPRRARRTDRGRQGTVAEDVRRRHPEVWISVSATTRPPRPGEQHGVHYWFVSDAEFDAMIADGHSCWSGRSSTGRPATAPRAAPSRRRWPPAAPAMLEIDLQGARQVRRTMPTHCSSSSRPPSWEELVRRLVGRGTETEEERARRLDDRAGGAGRRGGVRRHHREPRSSRCRRRVGSLDGDYPAEPVRALAHIDQLVRLDACLRPTSPPRASPTPRSTTCSTKTDSKYKLVLYSAKRARQINAYYSQLGEGLLEYVGPLVDTHVQEKPLSIALREINEDLLTCEDVDPAELAAEEAARPPPSRRRSRPSRA